MTGNRHPSWLLSCLAYHKRDALIALSLGLVASACAAMLMFTSGYLISATALAETTLFSVMIPVACVQLFGLGRPLARYVERLASHDWVLKVTSDLRLALYRSIAARTGDPELERAAGEYLGMLSDDVAHLQNLYLRVVFPSVIAYLLALLASVLFGFFSLPFAGAMLASLAVVAILVPYCSLLATRGLAQRSKELKRNATVSLVDDVRGSVDWVLAKRGEDGVARHVAADAAVRSLESSFRMRQRAFSLASVLLLGLMLCAVIVWAGDSFGREGAAANLIAAFALGFLALIEVLAVLPAAFSESTVRQLSVASLDDQLGCPVVSGFGPRPPATALGSIEFDHVVYSYPGSARRALDDVSLSVAPGQHVAILGRSGSGKSTFGKLVCSTIEPVSGEVRLTGEVGYLGQEPYLFNRTLRDNLKIGNPCASDSKLTALLGLVGLKDLLSSLPAGLDTVVGETGVGLSGGEEHRVALARVLAADTPIVLVDEPFSALDPETEASLLDALLSSCVGKTLIVITHHLAQIDRFDRVIFIENACIDLEGSPAELIAASERFRALVEFDRNR